MRLAPMSMDGIVMSAQREGEGKELLRPPCMQVSYATNVKVQYVRKLEEEMERSSLSSHTHYKEVIPDLGLS
jgi:hypothetical protein